MKNKTKVAKLEEVWYYAEGYQKVKLGEELYVTWIEWSELSDLKVGSYVAYEVLSKGPSTVYHATNKQVPESTVKLLSVVQKEG